MEPLRFLYKANFIPKKHTILTEVCHEITVVIVSILVAQILG